MTGQFADCVRYRRTDFKLAGISGGSLFDPAAYGLHPVGRSTANWRGYYCVYDATAGRLRLAELFINLRDDEEARALSGAPLLDVVPEPQYLTVTDASGETVRRFLESLRLAPLDILIPYTGGLLLGDDFIRDLYGYMVFHPAWKYRRVVELIFENGTLVRETDHSAAVEEFRHQVTAEDHRPSAVEDVRAWADRTFALDYDLHHPFR